MPPYLQYSLPARTDAQLQRSAVAFDRQADQIYGNNSADLNSASYEASATSYESTTSKMATDISDYIPKKGNYQSQVDVYMYLSRELLEPVDLVFGRSRVPAVTQRLETFSHDTCYKYVVSCNAPAFSTTESASPRVPLRIQLQTSTEADTGWRNVGPWVYENVELLEQQGLQDINRKRKMTLDQPEDSVVAKRISPIRPTMSDSQSYHSYSYGHEGAAYTQGLQPIDEGSVQRKLAQYGRSQHQQNVQEDSFGPGVQSFSTDANYAQSLLRVPGTHASAYSPYTSHQTIHSPALSSAASFQMSSSSPNPANPPLVRASTLQKPPSSISTTVPSPADGLLSPYGMHPKATIKIRGDLNTMQTDWTSEERTAKRRLVQFKGEQSGSTINTYFKAVKPDERRSPSAAREKRVSCIYWEERNEYYVTSVDTIALLETLVGARFGVEEKNRIRRNLETHHPETVFKAKPETESFFKVIMGFPDPKPRNIEKDVKVFSWPTLAQALIKVISKYVSFYQLARMDINS